MNQEHIPTSVNQVTTSDLPLSCPTPKQPLWNAHPKVYLPIDVTGTATCPYCGKQYILVDTHDATT